MSLDLVILPEADADITAAMRWYEKQQVGLGLEFVGVIDSTFERIRSTPKSFPLSSIDARFRRAVVDRFPYVVLFEHRKDAVEIVAVAHTRRMPGYWKDRSTGR